MKNAQLNAAMWMAQHMGIRNNAWKLSGKTGLNEEQLTAALMPYVAPAIEMYDIAEGVKMGDCAQPSQSFKAFTDWFCETLRDTGRAPEEPQALDQLAAFTFIAFTNDMTTSQDDILRSRLAAEVKEYAHE